MSCSIVPVFSTVIKYSIVSPYTNATPFAGSLETSFNTLNLLLLTSKLAATPSRVKVDGSHLTTLLCATNLSSSTYSIIVVASVSTVISSSPAGPAPTPPTASISTSGSATSLFAVSSSASGASSPGSSISSGFSTSSAFPIFSSLSPFSGVVVPSSDGFSLSSLLLSDDPLLDVSVTASALLFDLTNKTVPVIATANKMAITTTEITNFLLL